MADPDIQARFYAVLMEVKNVSASKTADTGKFKYDYVPLEDLMAEIKRACATQGFAVSQTLGMDGDLFTVTTSLIHAEGGVLSFPPAAILAPKDAQAMGSAATYLRRYSLTAIFGLATADDDDGAGATAAQRDFGPSRATQAGVAAPERTYRSPIEAQIRALLDVLPSAELRTIQAAFRDEFDCSLTQLPVARHAEALKWTQWMLQPGDQFGPSDGT